ncbi:MAG: ribonuclease III [Acidobacteriota bacterium]
MTDERLEELHRLETKLKYRFADRCTLDRALTHKSFIQNPVLASSFEGRPGSYESLEFLGDSILGFIISEFLFLNYPQLPEGQLSKIKSYLVSTDRLFRLSRDFDLGEFLHLSHGEEKTGGRKKKAILADLFESVLAAIFLDGGLEPAREFVLIQFDPYFQEIASGNLDVKDHKSSLQEELHTLGLPQPRYRVIEEAGPEHHKEFTVEVHIDGKHRGLGSGKTKKEAEQRAAESALESLSAPS